MQTTEYRCLLIRPHSHSVLAIAAAGKYHLPRLRIRAESRPTRELQSAIREEWGLSIFVLEMLGTPRGAGVCAVAELRAPQSTLLFLEVAIEQLAESEFSAQERELLDLLIDRRLKSPVTRLGWIDEAIEWMKSATGRTFHSASIDQWNGGGGFALLRLASDDGRHYWLKATAEPNTGEFALTRLLWEVCPGSLPRLVATKSEWNAWIIEHAGEVLPDLPSEDELVSAARAFAHLQLLTIGHSGELLAAGAIDQRLSILRSHIDRIIAYLIEAMAQQTSTKAPALSRDRLLELGEMLRDACYRLESLDLPDTLLHNDLNAGNILRNGANYVFTDWSEAAVGNPLLSSERLCRLNPCHRESVRGVYRDCWPNRLDEAFGVAPLLAIYAYLYGRGDWLRQPESVSPGFESYSRSLARHMDRAAKEISLREVLCR